MSKLLRTLGTALIASGLCAFAHASITTLDFEELAVGEALSDQYKGIGLNFSPVSASGGTGIGALTAGAASGAVVRRNGVGGVIFPFPPPGGPNFLLNSDQGVDFAIDLLAGYQLNSLSLRYSANSIGLTILFFDELGNSSQGFSVNNGSLQNWTIANTLIPTTGSIRRIEFVTAGGGRFAVDDLALGLTQLASPSLPEPAALGLVALALVGAGAATRRRRPV